MIFHENRLPADDSQEMSCLVCYFWKSSKIINCRLMQIIGGTLWVNERWADFLGLFLGVFRLRKFSNFRGIGFPLQDAVIKFRILLYGLKFINCYSLNFWLFAVIWLANFERLVDLTLPVLSWTNDVSCLSSNLAHSLIMSLYCSTQEFIFRQKYLSPCSDFRHQDRNVY